MSACLPAGPDWNERRVAYRAEVGIYDMIVHAIDDQLGAANV